MAYLGVNPSNPDLSRTAALPRDAERFSGNGSTTNFTLSRSLYGATDAQVVVENVNQEPIVAYDIVGNQLVFTEAPPSGTNNIYVVYRAVQGAQVTLPDGSVSYNKLANNIRLFTVDNYIANSSISTYALSEAPADANTLAVSIDGIVQRAPINYTVSGQTITFTSAPPTGANVHIKHLGFRSSSVVTAIPAGTTITQPVLSNPTITLAAQDSSFKGNVALFDSAGTSQVGRFGATSTGQVQLDVGANTLSVRSSTIALANVTSFSTANVSGITGVSVDAAGRLTVPNQPSFLARYSTTKTKAAGWNFMPNFDYTDWNTGGHFNGTTTFTAPTAGLYVFTAGGFFTTGTSGADVRVGVSITKNGGDYQIAGGQLSTGDSPFPISTFIVKAAQNDQFRLICYSPGDIVTGAGANYSFIFAGYLVG